MPQLLHSDDARYSLKELQDFFNVGLPSLRHIQVEEIMVVEPLGDRLTIPVRFIESIEVSTSGLPHYSIHELTHD